VQTHSVSGRNVLATFGAIAAASSALLTAQPAAAAVITSLPDGVKQEFTRNARQVRGPQAFGDGHAYETTTTTGAETSSYFGYTGSFTFPSGESGTNWGGGEPFAAVGLTNAIMSFTFDAPVAGVLADFVWTRAADKVFTLSAYNSAGALLESLSFNATDPTYVEGFYGFQRATNDISRFEVNGYYFGARDLSTYIGAVSAVPEPATWAMMIVGFGLTGSLLRSRRRERVFV
jgi:hypothetical protein